MHAKGLSIHNASLQGRVVGPGASDRRGSPLRSNKVLSTTRTRPLSPDKLERAHSSSVQPQTCNVFLNVSSVHSVAVRRRSVINRAGETDAPIANTGDKRTSAFLVGLFWFFFVDRVDGYDGVVDVPREPGRVFVETRDP